MPIGEADEHLDARYGSDDDLQDALARVQAGSRRSMDAAMEVDGSLVASIGSTSTTASS